MDDVTKGIGSILSNAKLALLGLCVVVKPLVRLSKASMDIAACENDGVKSVDEGDRLTFARRRV